MNTLAHPVSRWHQRMWGALLVKRLPGLSRPSLSLEQAPQGLFLLWLSFMGLLVFAASVMAQHGLWLRLVQADPTGLTIVIVLLFTGCSLWAGARSWQLGLQWQALSQTSASPHGMTAPVAMTEWFCIEQNEAGSLCRKRQVP